MMEGYKFIQWSYSNGTLHLEAWPRTLDSPEERFRKTGRAADSEKWRKKTVDIWVNLYIIGVSMIEARMSRVRLPQRSGPGRGKGAFAEASALPPEGAGAGPGDNILRTVTPLGGALS